MRKPNNMIILITSLIITALVLSSCTEQGNTINIYGKRGQALENTDYTTIEASALNLKIDYPISWEKKEDIMGIALIFLSPLEGTTDTFQENINLIIQDISNQPITLDEYVETNLADMDQFLENITISKSERVTINGLEGHELIYSGHQGEEVMKWRQLVIINNDKAYLLTYTAKQDTYDLYQEEVNAVINSFEVTS